MDEWVETRYKETCCNAQGELIAATIDLNVFLAHLKLQRPGKSPELIKIVRRLDRRISSQLCRDFQINSEGFFVDSALVQRRLAEVRTDLNDTKCKAIIQRIEAQNVAAAKAKTQSANPSVPLSPPTPSAKGGFLPPLEVINMQHSEAELHRWIKDQYLSRGFTKQSFIGWKKFLALLVGQRPQLQDQINKALLLMRKPGHVDSLESPLNVQHSISAARSGQDGAATTKPRPDPKVLVQQLSSAIPELKSKSLPPDPALFAPTQAKPTKPTTSKSAKLLSSANSKPDGRGTAHNSTSSQDGSTPVSSGATSVTQGTTRTGTPDFARYSQLLTGRDKPGGTGMLNLGTRRDIEQAPLLSGSVVLQHAHDLVPQYGLLGCLDYSQEPSEHASQLFLNTNVPMSTFICGAQGSGKSHTTACILENAIIPSAHLGQLEKPMSTLVFSYGEWSSGGAGFSISEAAYLAAPSKIFPGHQAQRVTVLTSPSNLAINKLYLRLPNVRIIPFKLRAKTLDIGALRTLMAVDDKSSIPLYMAKVESILRDIAAKSQDGCLDYTKFKKRLKEERFDAAQSNMLDMRLNLLESFLDLSNQAPQPEYTRGDITIIDLSDAFMSANTACILFKLGLERFLQSPTPGKLVVLDEAHKYMLDTPGSKILTDYVTRTIRLQRHQGARVVISTQEPTAVSPELIALCSVTIIHRFTSPAWYRALKKHIPALHDDDDAAMREIERLETGVAFVYAPNAVLDTLPDGALVKATGRLLRLSIRKRVTLDGGESIMAV
ncbi:hypothetical protein ACEQ8H_004615 [Pleosporales sp. CAS-2024a]